MRCLSCKYDLSNLTPNEEGYRCPECGRKFDPNNPRTYFSPPAGKFRRLAQLLVALLIGWLLFMVAFAILTYVPAVPGNPFTGIGPAVFLALFVGVVEWYWSLPLALIIFVVLILRDRRNYPTN
ncbi:MAG TPA: hypothetical protein VG711_00045 [Phycisphaerales bacterium]|nr:hypothetical protein [Phycisphaerales bacterium]